jgi:hypothetical protein
MRLDGGVKLMPALTPSERGVAVVWGSWHVVYHTLVTSGACVAGNGALSSWFCQHAGGAISTEGLIPIRLGRF